jgi:chaperonin GroEL (HSP60 family)
MITLDNEELLKNIVKTAMTGKGSESEKAKFSRIIVTAIKQIEEK